MLAILPTMTLKACAERSGKLSIRNSKMPGSTFAIAPSACKVGGKLVNVAGSTCSRCYAMKLERMRPSVRMGWADNLNKAVTMLQTNPAQWVADMIWQIEHYAKKTGVNYHRWFDSGDLQSVEMLNAIFTIAEKTTHINYWLPTREARIVRDAIDARGAPMPGNLVIRVSSTMIGDKPVARAANTSTVHRKGVEVSGWKCPASSQGGACGDCRACWTPSVANVSYPLH